MVKKRGTAHAQALVEFAIALPILILLVAGVLELGRGYSYAVATSDAARDGARYVSGKTATTNGPGLAAIVARVRGTDGAIPLVASYDPLEKTWRPPLLCSRCAGPWGWSCGRLSTRSTTPPGR